MKKMLSFTYKYKLHHILFWLVYYVGWVAVYKSFYTQLSDLLLVTLVYALSHSTMYYTTQYLFIPRLLKKRRIALFILAFLGLLIFSVFAMYFGIQLILGADLIKTFKVARLQVLITFAFSNVFMTAVLIMLKALLDYIRNHRSEERKEKERLEAELQYLKAQVNPHFLFNTINSVYVLIKSNPDKASETLIKLSDLLRAQLYDFSHDKITIEQEISYLQNYIELEKLRKGEKLRVDFNKSNTLQGFKIAPLMLMPFLENCFKHVSSKPNQQNTINVDIDLQNEKIKAVFFNTREEESKTSENLPGGIGLKNINRRLELLYPGAYKLDIKDTPDSYQVTLILDTYEL